MSVKTLRAFPFSPCASLALALLLVVPSEANIFPNLERPPLRPRPARRYRGRQCRQLPQQRLQSSASALRFLSHHFPKLRLPARVATPSPGLRLLTLATRLRPRLDFVLVDGV
jgi:hypothetical protein